MEPGRGGWLVFGISVLAGAALPVFYYFCRTRQLFPGRWFWVLAKSSGLRLFLGAVLAALLCRIVWAAHSAGSVRWRRAATTGMFVIFGLIFFAWRNRADFGDVTWLKFADDPFLFGSSPLGHWIHCGFYALCRLTGVSALLARVDAYYTPARVAVSMSSACAGLAWLTGLVWMVPRLVRKPGTAWATILFLALAPTSIFFFAYPEVTPWAYALLGLHLLGGMRYLRLGLTRPPVYETIPLALAIWVHGAVNFASAAQAMLLIHWFFKMGQDDRSGIFHWKRIAWGAMLSAAPFAPLALTLAWAKHHPELCRTKTGMWFHWYGDVTGGNNQRMWIGIENENFFTRGMFLLSYNWLMGMVNIAMTAFPMILAAPAAVLTLPRRRRREMVFLGCSLIGLIPYMMFWEADLGYLQDLDLFGLPGIPIALFIALWWSECMSEKQQKAAAVIVAAATFIFFFSAV